MKTKSRIHQAFDHIAGAALGMSSAVIGPRIWNGTGALSSHRKTAVAVSMAFASASLCCLALHSLAGAVMLALASWTILVLAAVYWLRDRGDAIRLFGGAKSAQECADLIVSEMREESMSLDEEQIAESVATVLLQQSLDLLGFVEARVAHNQGVVYHVIGSAQCRTGEKVEFMGKLRLWWSSDRIRCDSLGMIWR